MKLKKISSSKLSLLVTFFLWFIDFNNSFVFCSILFVLLVFCVHVSSESTLSCSPSSFSLVLISFKLFHSRALKFSLQLWNTTYSIVFYQGLFHSTLISFPHPGICSQGLSRNCNCWGARVEGLHSGFRCCCKLGRNAHKYKVVVRG